MDNTDKWFNEGFEKDLLKYRDEFIETDFVPFPTIDYAVEAVVETAGYTTPSDEYIRMVGEALLAEYERRMQAFADSWLAPAPEEARGE